MLTSAYFAVGDPAWDFQARLQSTDNPRFGYFIELLRLFLFVWLGMVALGAGFSWHLTNLLAIEKRDTWDPRTTLARLVLVATVVGFGGYFVGDCFDQTREGLLSRQVAFGQAKGLYPASFEYGEFAHYDQQIGSTRRALACYSLYAAIMYGAILPLLLVVPAYALATEDLREIACARDTVTQAVFGGHAIDVVRTRFLNFHQTLTRVSHRYVRLLACVGAAVAFEQYVGGLAMSDDVKTTNTGVAIAVALITGLTFAVVLYLYYDVWHTVNGYLIDRGEESGLGDEKFAPSAYVRFLAKRNKVSYVVVALLATPVFSARLRDLLEKALQFLG